MRKKSVLFAVLGCVLVFAAVFVVRSSVPSDVEKPLDDYTLGEIQDILLTYLDETDSNLELGTQEFYDFTLDQLLGSTDAELMEHPQFSLICTYLAHYKIAFDDACWTALVAEENGMSREESLETYFRFHETEEFLGTTIGQLREEVAQQDARCEAIMAERQAVVDDGEAGGRDCYASMTVNLQSDSADSCAVFGPEAVNGGYTRVWTRFLRSDGPTKVRVYTYYRENPDEDLILLNEETVSVGHSTGTLFFPEGSQIYVAVEWTEGVSGNVKIGVSVE